MNGTLPARANTKRRKKVLITGATGLLGQALLDLLRSGGHDVRCLARTTSPVERLKGFELAYGDAGDEGSILRALDGVDAFVHVAGLEYAPQVLPAVRRARVRRLLIISSTSVHSAHEPRSGWRRRMEERVRESGLEWTIVRPAMIYGSERDHNIHHLLRFLDRSPVFPIFGPGTNLWQPVYYEDCARGVLAALERDEAVGRDYDLPGAEPLTYLELVRVVAAALGKNPRVVRLPLEPVRRTLELAELARVPLPVKSEQVLRLQEDKAYPYDAAREDLGYAPRAFPEGVALEVARLREIGLVDA